MKEKIVGIFVFMLLVGTVLPVTGTVIKTNNTALSNMSGNTLYVGGSGDGNYTCIQDAIDDAVDGDTVFVYDNSSPYYKHVKVNKSINLIGENKQTTVIDGSGWGDVVYIYADWVTVRGFTIQNGNIGIKIFSDHNTITGNTISNNVCGIRLCYQGGFVTFTSNYNIILKNNFLDNEQDAFFEGEIRYQWVRRNRWRQNYWNPPRTFPKLIFGFVWIEIVMGITVRIPWINIDWFPAQEPYDI